MKNSIRIKAFVALQNLQAYCMQDNYSNRYNPLSPDQVDELLEVFTPQEWHVMQEAVLALHGEK